MTTQAQGSSLLDVLKKKMRLTKEEMEKYKEEAEDMGRKLQVEIMRREEVNVRQPSTGFFRNRQTLVYREMIWKLPAYKSHILAI